MYKKNENLLEIRLVGLLICYIDYSISVLKFDSFMQKLKYLKTTTFFWHVGTDSLNFYVSP